MKFHAFIVITTLALSGCDNQTSSQSVAAPASVAESAEVTPSLWLDTLPDCTAKQIATLHWTAALVKKGPVDIFVGEAESAPLFGRVGGPGSKQTGAWTKPGTAFVARDQAGTEVARAVAMGPDCP